MIIQVAVTRNDFLKNKKDDLQCLNKPIPAKPMKLAIALKFLLIVLEWMTTIN